MDGANSPTPDMLSSLGGFSSQETGDERTGSPSSSSSSNPSSNSALPPSTPQPPPASFGGQQPSEKLSFKEQTALLSPNHFFKSIGDQLLGEKTEAQKQAEQAQASKAQQRVQQSQQEFQNYQARVQAEEQKRIGETVEMKSQALKVGSYAESSAVRTQTTRGDLSEQSIITLAMKNAQDAKAREQKARQAMAAHSTQKGPQAENSKPKANMFAHMQSGGNENGHKLSDDTDSKQRAREQAMGE